MELPGNRKVSGCQAGVGEGLQKEAAGEMRNWGGHGVDGGR